MKNCNVTTSWLFFTSTEKEASPMAEIFPETEPCSVGFPNRLVGWEASALDETATPKHAIKTVRMNRETSVKIVRKRIASLQIAGWYKNRWHGGVQSRSPTGFSKPN